jgi:hypothetical protein
LYLARRLLELELLELGVISDICTALVSPRVLVHTVLTALFATLPVVELVTLLLLLR